MKTSRIKPLYLIITLIILSGCDMLGYHPYDCKIEGETGLTLKNIERIEAKEYGDTLRFAVISDTQRWYDDLNDAVRAINSHSEISFVINCGDLSDFGATDEFMWQRDIMQRLKMPYICIIGNHDMIGTGESAYKEIFGSLNFTFKAGRTLFVCLNTNALEEKYMDEAPDFKFLQDALDMHRDDVDNTFVVIHAQPGSEQFNNNVKEQFHSFIQKFPGLQCCLSGHGHTYRDEALFNDSIHYIMCPCIHKREFFIFTAANGNYSYERVGF